MLDALKAAGAIAGLMKNKEALKGAGERIKARLAEHLGVHETLRAEHEALVRERAHSQ